MRDLGLLAAQVRAVRGLLGWSLAYLAEGINARRATITDFENGKHELREAIEPVAMIRYPPLTSALRCHRRGMRALGHKPLGPGPLIGCHQKHRQAKSRSPVSREGKNTDRDPAKSRISANLILFAFSPSSTRRRRVSERPLTPLASAPASSFPMDSLDNLKASVGCGVFCCTQ